MTRATLRGAATAVNQKTKAHRFWAAVLTLLLLIPAGPASGQFQGQWERMTDNAQWTVRRAFASVALPNGNIVLMGGINVGKKNDVWRFTDQGATWDLMTDNAGWSGRNSHSSVALPNGSIVLMGGNDGAMKNDVWRSEDQGATWDLMTGGAGWSAREVRTSVALPDGNIVLMGGWPSNGFVKNDVWRSTDQGATWANMTENAGWSARSSHSSVALPDGSIVLMGGVFKKRRMALREPGGNMDTNDTCCRVAGTV